MNPLSGLVLLDTCVVLHLVRGNEIGRRIDAAYGLRARPDRPLVSVITVGEALALARRLGWTEKKQARLEGLLRELVVVDISSRPVLQGYAEMHEFLVRNGHPIGDNDIWIAATAAAASATLLTNDKDFDPLDGKFVTRIYIDPGGSQPAPPTATS